MANTCVCGLNNSGTTQLFSANSGIASAFLDENGRLILTRADGSFINAGTVTDCCTLASKNYALSTIQANPTALGGVTVTLNTFGVSAVGEIQTTPAITPSGTTVNILPTGATIPVTVAVRDIESIEFENEPISVTAGVTSVLPGFNCDASITTPQCASNIALETRLRDLITTITPVAPIPTPTTFPFPLAVTGAIELTTNFEENTPITTIYGICNGILWAESDATFQAIPLCNIAAISYDPA